MGWVNDHYSESCRAVIAAKVNHVYMVCGTGVLMPSRARTKRGFGKGGFKGGIGALCQVGDARQKFGQLLLRVDRPDACHIGIRKARDRGNITPRVDLRSITAEILGYVTAIAEVIHDVP